MRTAGAVALTAAVRSGVAHAAVPGDDAGGRGVFGDLLADAGTGLELIHRQYAQPLRIESGWIAAAAGLAVGALLAWTVRLAILRLLGGFLQRSHRHTELAIHGRAIGSVVVTAVCFAFAGLATLAGVHAGLVLLPDVDALANVLFMGWLLSGIGFGIGRALRSPDAKHLRPVPLPPGLGRTIGLYPLAAGAMLGIAAFIDQASRILQASDTSWTVAQGALVIAELALIARFLVHAGRARERQMQAASDDDGTAIPAVFGITALAWAALLVALGALVLGHVRFAMSLLQGMLWAALVLTLAWLTTRFLDALVARLLGSERAAARFATGIVGVRQSRLEQGALLVNAVLSLIVWLFAILLVVAPLQGGGDTVAEQLRPAPMLESLRTLSLSPRTLLIAAAVLFGGIFATRVARGWLERRFLPSTSLDIGARTSIVTGLGYVGVIVALLATSATLGLQLEKITLLVSALTVGIGFGLQAIIQNFVSGVIMLFERPIKPGDWVSVTGSEGRVRRMRVRATEVVADDGSIAIVPNSAFISSTVLNRSSAKDRASFDLTIKVSGAESAEAAREGLRARIATCAAIRRNPAPRFYLESMADRSWSFRVRMQATGDQSQAATTSELLFHLDAMNSDGISVSVE